MNTEEKIRTARRLMAEVDAEIISVKRIESSNKICECGHKRSDHGTAYSINYTGGFCSKCKCKHFLTPTP